MAPLQVAIEVVEAPLGGKVLRLIAQVPLSQGPRDIPLCSQQVGESLLANVQAEGGLPRLPIGRDHPFQAVACW